MQRTLSTWLAALVVAALSGVAQATPVSFQGFETDAADWDANGYGAVTRVGTGTNGIASADGSFHAIFEGTGGTGPFTRFDGYRSAWPGPFTASIDIFLDTSWAAGSGFDYSVAANGSDGNHQRDYIFHVTQDTSSGSLLVAGSNNTNGAPREDLDTLNNHAVIANSGWYTFQHQFYDLGGQLAVDLVLLDDVGSELFRETRTNVADAIPTEVGGNRYGWFTFIDVDRGIAVDNVALSLNSVPEPTALALLGLGLLAARRRRA